jgi:iron(III) transport system ATP-binding protein
VLSVEALTKQYRGFEGRPGAGVFGVSFDLAEGELFTLLGPSGCGKTTTLRAVAGLERPDLGRIRIAGRDVFDAARGIDVALPDRGIGMVFQSYAIWPHMSVFENASYPLRVARPRRTEHEVRAKVMPVLEKLGLADFAKRPATQLSGGQQQRLALARALTREPALLLLDEPLSNLDAQLREQMRAELKRLQRETGVTTIYVTHDQAEALAISDRIAVMEKGRIAQVGRPKEIYGQPASEFVAGFIGRTNLLKGAVANAVAAGATASVKTELGFLDAFFPFALAAGGEVSLVVRPEHVAIVPRGTSGDVEGPANRLSGEIVQETYLGETVEYAVAVGGGEMLVRTASGLEFSPADSVSLVFPSERTIALRPG